MNGRKVKKLGGAGNMKISYKKPSERPGEERFVEPAG